MASLLHQAFPALRRAAPRLSQEFFTCSARLAPVSAPLAKPFPQGPVLRALRWQSSHALKGGQSPLGALAQELQTKAPAKPVGNVKKSSFPETSDKSVAYWLLGSAVSVFGIVVFGGLTRLTESGYSSLYICLLLEHRYSDTRQVEHH